MYKSLTHTACLLSFVLNVFFPLKLQNTDLFFQFTNKIPANEFVLPKHDTEDLILRKSAFSLKYNEKIKQPDWVAYELTLNEVYGNETKRTNNFKIDREITTGTATNDDYKYSGYDKGHLAPAGDMKFSKQAMEESFLFTNICPQVPAFNRGIWASLESMVRYWAVVNEAVMVVCGPIFYSDEYITIGLNKIGIPDAFYKIILDYREPEKKAIAFIIPNRKKEEEMAFYVCSVDDAELITGQDFFPFLSPYDEKLLESSYDLELWPMIEFSYTTSIPRKIIYIDKH